MDVKSVLVPVLWNRKQERNLPYLYYREWRSCLQTNTGSSCWWSTFSILQWPVFTAWTCILQNMLCRTQATIRPWWCVPHSHPSWFLCFWSRLYRKSENVMWLSMEAQEWVLQDRSSSFCLQSSPWDLCIWDWSFVEWVLHVFPLPSLVWSQTVLSTESTKQVPVQKVSYIPLHP